MGANMNPMMNIGGVQSPLNSINPSDLRNDPQALYAYQQMMARQKMGTNMLGTSAINQPDTQNLSPQVQQWQQAILAKYFPNLRF